MTDRRTAFPYIAIWGIALAITMPWFLTEGFLFFLDFVWAPNMPSPGPLSTTSFIPGWLTHWTLWLITQVFPAELIQKVYITMLFGCAGTSMFQLGQCILQPQSNKISWLSSLIASFFYMTNLFVIERLMMGHHLVLLAYAITPWVVYAYLHWIGTSTWKYATLFLLSFFGVIAASIHHIILLPLLIIILTPYPKMREISVSQRYVALGVLGFIFAGTLLHHSIVSQSSFSLHESGPALFAPVPLMTSSIWIDALSLSAQWKDDLSYALPFESFTYYQAIYFIFLAIAIIGALHMIVSTSIQRLGFQLLTIAVISLMLGVGLSSPLTQPLTSFLYTHVPFWIGLRDSAKWFALLALVESIWLAYGLYFLTSKLSSGQARLFAGGMLCLSLLLIFPVLHGASGQIMPKTYPVSWYEWNSLLADHPEQQTMLFLPWHLYLSFSFTSDVVIANPAPLFFSNARVIAGDNLEAGGIGGKPYLYTDSHRPASRTVENALFTMLQDHQNKNFGSLIAPLEIRYVAFTAEHANPELLERLQQQSDLSLVFQQDDLFVWENTALPGT